MFIHIFAFRWKPAATTKHKELAASEIRGLHEKIPGILETHVGTNQSLRGENYEFGGIMKFADKAGFVAYNEHPVHKELLTWLFPLIEPLELDFECLDIFPGPALKRA